MPKADFSGRARALPKHCDQILINECVWLVRMAECSLVCSFGDGNPTELDLEYVQINYTDLRC